MAQETTSRNLISDIQQIVECGMRQAYANVNSISIRTYLGTLRFGTRECQIWPGHTGILRNEIEQQKQIYALQRQNENNNSINY